MTTGAVAGHGIYFGNDAATSFGYTHPARPLADHDVTFEKEQQLWALCIVEVDGRLGGAVQHSWCVTSSNDRSVKLKHLVIPGPPPTPPTPPPPPAADDEAAQ